MFPDPSLLEDFKRAPFTKDLGSEEAWGTLWTVWTLRLLLQG